MRVHIVIDMQNDFITGSLANPAAEAIVKPICDYLKSDAIGSRDMIIVTRDTHYANYLDTQEGKKLPFTHCIHDTEGWQVNADICEALADMRTKKKLTQVIFHNKPTFGDAARIAREIVHNTLIDNIDEIVLMGTCTDICVISNALGLKPEFPDVPIKVIASLCAGLTPEKHEAALEVMRSCQVEVK